MTRTAIYSPVAVASSGYGATVGKAAAATPETYVRTGV
jgi:hypothetical protein